MTRIENYIAGEAKPVKAYAPSFNPYNQETIAEYPLSDATDVDSAVVSADRALHDWRRLSFSQRGEYLDKIAAEIEKRSEAIAQAITLSGGKPISEARFDVLDSIDCYRYYAKLARAQDSQQNAVVETEADDLSSRTRREPVGVVALITPWNFPTVTTSWKLAPALAAGCTVVLKPSEITPLPESYLAEICAAVELPAGVVNITYGAGETGAELVRHPDVRKVSFTGSTETGGRIATAVAADIKNLSLELGGKSSIIVCEDADLELATSAVIGGIFFNNGQICSATSRLLVHESIASDLLKRLCAEVAKMTPSDPTEEDAVLGPLACKAQFEKVRSYLQIAREEELDALIGADVYDHPSCAWMIEPTIFADVPTTSRLWNEEIFGPVLCCRTFSSDEEAIREANNCEYGLAATVISRDEERADNLAFELEAGHIWINTDQRVLAETSWGGMKKSGIGRELGPWGLAAFTEIKHITKPSGV